MSEALRDQFERRFWLPELGTYALALQAGGRPAAVGTSNPGHALWAGIAPSDRAAAVRDSLMSDDLFSGWGVRTLSRAARRYNPVGYHLGTMERPLLLRSMVPLYLAWAASFVREVRDRPREDAEARIEQLCRAFETAKPHLISRWRWPDRFNP